MHVDIRFPLKKVILITFKRVTTRYGTRYSACCGTFSLSSAWF